MDTDYSSTDTSLALMCLWVAGIRSGWSPLMRATADGRPELVNNLLLSGALANAKTKSGDRPLHHAVKGGHLGVVKLLLKAGAAPSSRRKVRQDQREKRTDCVNREKDEQGQKAPAAVYGSISYRSSSMRE